MAASAPEALKIIEKEDLDLVILDIRMPGMTGVEALPRILGLKENLPVILNTAYSSISRTLWPGRPTLTLSSHLT